MSKTIYLGGAFAQFTPEQVEARQAQIEQHLHPSIKVNKPRHSGTYSPTWGSARGATLTLRDMLMVKEADVLMLDCLEAKEVSRGSMVEIGWASALGKPFIIIAEEGNPHIYVMAQTLTPFIVPTREQAVEIANTLLT